MKLKPTSIFCIIMLQIIFCGKGITQDLQNIRQIRIKENFDFNWQFHKSDIAMKLFMRVGQKGITHVDLPTFSNSIICKSG